jgi:hypothetical protein
MNKLPTSYERFFLSPSFLYSINISTRTEEEEIYIYRYKYSYALVGVSYYNGSYVVS